MQQSLIKTKFLCLAGYLYFGFLMLSMLLMVFAMILIGKLTDSVKVLELLIKLALPLLALFWFVIKGFYAAVFTKLPEPEGVLLDHESAGEFYKVLQEICNKTKCPEIHEVKLDFSVNAYISEQPRLGIFGWYKRYLVIGVPLLLMLEPRELEAVIAHECGHLSKSHSQTSLGIYRARNLWYKINEELKKRNKDKTFFIRKFMHNYIPALNEVMHSINKEYEYQADRIAADAVGPVALASSLLKMQIYEAQLENSFWPKIYELNTCHIKPPKDLFFRMEADMKQGLQEKLVGYIIENISNYKSLPSSTHPSYIERVEALHAEVPLPEATITSALREFFIQDGDMLLTRLSLGWAEKIETGWFEYYDDYQKMCGRLNQLNEKKNDNMLESDEVFERAYLIEKTQGLEKALDAYQESLEIYPENIYLEYNIGKIMTYQNKPEGVELLKKIMEKDYQMIPDCCDHLVNYYLVNDERSTASDFYHFALEFMRTNEEVCAERSILPFEEVYGIHDLGYNTIMEIRKQLEKYVEIKKGYVVIKRMELSGLFPKYLMAIRYKKGTNEIRIAQIQQEIAESAVLPWEYWVAPLNKKNRQLEFLLDQIPDSRIY